MENGRKCTSKYRGVCKRLNETKYRVSITIDGMQIFLGSSKNEFQAAYAYNLAAIRYYGENARLNDIEPQEDVIIDFNKIDAKINKT